MDSPAKLREATHWLQSNLTFDMDQRVHVFEVTIRVLGRFGTGHAALHTKVTAETASSGNAPKYRTFADHGPTGNTGDSGVSQLCISLCLLEHGAYIKHVC